MASDIPKARDILSEAVGRILDNSELDEGQLTDLFFDIFDNEYDLPSILYTPSEKLISRIADYNQWCETHEGEDQGQLMEEIAFLAFKCLKGYVSLKSYPSYSQQHDLVISGTKKSWTNLIEFLRLETARTIVVEAKNTDKKVDDPQFSRLCSIVQNKFESTCKLGVFFTRNGASGFPSGKSAKRKQSLSEAWATQIIFHAKTGKFIIVLDDKDIQELGKKGALPRILEAKIREVEDGTGLSRFNAVLDDGVDIDLPPHLLKHMEDEKR